MGELVLEMNPSGDKHCTMTEKGGEVRTEVGETVWSHGRREWGSFFMIVSQLAQGEWWFVSHLLCGQ